ncbi:CPS40 [Mytilus edulis]|uniref:CXXC1 n=1 Tax=Mytilus edulis TaxID=6550 RepID=A0A8S3TNN2_MYTED|nr:CPS40 [Mytilus edulis]
MTPKATPCYLSNDIFTSVFVEMEFGNMPLLTYIGRHIGRTIQQSIAWLKANLDTEIQLIGDIWLFVWIGTCNLTSIDKNTRYISLSSFNNTEIVQQITQGYKEIIDLLAKYPNCRVTFLETPFYSIINWNTKQHHKDPYVFSEQEHTLEQQVIALNKEVKTINTSLHSHSPDFNYDLYRTSKYKSSKHKGSTKQRKFFNIALYPDGIHPDPALAKAWLQFNLSFVVVEQHGVELSNLNIDSCYKIFNRKANNQPGNLLKFTMNLYHTTNKMTVNGGRVDIFINDIFDKICAEIQNHYTELNICNKTIHSQLSIIKDSLSNIIQKDLKRNQMEALKTTEDQLSTVDLNTSGLQLAESEDGEICPNCEQTVQTEGIACDSCNNWFHYKCVGLTEDHINSYQQLEYHCDQCNDDLLYVGATFIPQTDNNNQQLPINTSSSEPTISSHETQDHTTDTHMDSPAQKSSLEFPHRHLLKSLYH